LGSEVGGMFGRKKGKVGSGNWKRLYAKRDSMAGTHQGKAIARSESGAHGRDKKRTLENF